MNFRKFLSLLKFKIDLSKEPRFGILFHHNNPEKKALLIVNNRDAVFLNIEITVSNTEKQFFFKKIDRLDARAAMLISFDELLDNKQNSLKGLVIEAKLTHNKKKYTFRLRDDKFYLV